MGITNGKDKNRANRFLIFTNTKKKLKNTTTTAYEHVV